MISMRWELFAFLFTLALLIGTQLNRPRFYR